MLPPEIKLAVFEATEISECEAINKFLSDPKIQVVEIHTSCSGAGNVNGRTFRNYITIAYCVQDEPSQLEVDLQRQVLI